MKRLVTVSWLTVLWLVLWRDLSLANAASGIVISSVVAAVLKVPWAGGEEGQVRVRPLGVVTFLGYFAWKLLEANVVLAREIVTPRNHIQTGIIAVPLAGSSAQVVTVVANAVSLTPGTVTLEVRESGGVRVLYVHVLHLHDVERAREDVRTLSRLARRALQRDLGPVTDQPRPTP